MHFNSFKKRYEICFCNLKQSYGNYYSYMFYLFPLLAVPCPGLSKVSNQILDPFQGTYSYGDNVTFKCDEGYQLTSADTITCQSDGKWSNQQPNCTGLFI